ncbi:MAG: hypothetical protein MI892_14430, partial [Desulfobacterales bacterium]|nr:hypothetical protein [Desulfobacterales bacterium]
MGIKEIFKQGMQEFKRRSALGKEKREYKNHEKAYAERLTALGKKAWDAQLDLERYGELKNSITESQTQIDELKTRQADLENQQSTLDKKKQSENAGFESRRKEVEDKKKHVDSRLNDERKALKTAQKDQDTAKSRLKQIDKETVGEDVLDYILESRAGAVRMARIISSLLEFSRGIQPSSEEKHINDTIRDAVKAMSP